MGTRADFYVGRGPKADWLGSIAWDGYPRAIPATIRRCKSVSEYRAAVSKFLDNRDDATFPKDGWPWPWEDSNTTDYAYAFDAGKVWYTGFGKWECAYPYRPKNEPDDYDFMRDRFDFPNMKDKQNVALGKRSGLIVVFGGK
jgi:hypothetical protein